MGYCAPPTLTSLGVLRPAGSPEYQQDPGLGILSDASRDSMIQMRALAEGGQIEGSRSRVGFQPSPAPTVSRMTPAASGVLNLAARVAAAARKRMLAAAAERAYNESRIVDAERIVGQIDRPLWGRPAAPTNGAVFAVDGPRPVLKVGDPEDAGVFEERRPPPSFRGRDTSGIPTPPGLQPGGGGAAMRPPGSEDTATEIVGAPTEGGAGKLVPLAIAAALMFLGK